MCVVMYLCHTRTNSGSEKLSGHGAPIFDRTVCSVVNLIQDLPVNIKFVIEGMEEAGSVGLEELVRREKDRFFSSVDYVVISDNLWINQGKPALTYGTRGNSYFRVEVFASSRSGEGRVHSGILEGRETALARAEF